MITGLRYSILAVICAIYSFVFAELFVRVFAAQAFVPRNVMAAAYGVRANTPNATYLQRTPEMSAIVHINGQGLRAPHEFAFEKPEGISRIAIFGDSYFLGYEGVYEDIASSRLEAMLNDAGCTVEVLNFSVSGFGTSEMLRTLEAKALAYQPDLVVFQWHHTDPDDNFRSNLYKLEGGALKPTGEVYIPAVRARTALSNNTAYRFLSGHSHLFVATREKLSRLVRRAMAGHVIKRNTTGDGDAAMAERIASETDLAILSEAERLSGEMGAPFYVVDVPGVQARTRFRTSFRLLPDEVVARHNFVSPIEEFNRAASVNTKLYWEKGHKHLTPKGNDIIAKMMALRFLNDRRVRAALKCDSAGLAKQLADVPRGGG